MGFGHREGASGMQLLVAAALLAAALSGNGAVSTCRNADGSVLFTQFDCPQGTAPSARRDAAGEQADRHAQGAAPGRSSIVSMPPLSQAESASLRALAADLDRQRQARSRARDRRAVHQQRQLAEDRSLCQEARDELDAIRTSRRSGYSAAEARQLGAAENRWRRQRREHC